MNLNDNGNLATYITNHPSMDLDTLVCFILSYE